MKDFKERARRSDRFRQWYYAIDRARDRSTYRRLICKECSINVDVFYKMLEGRIYISDERCKLISKVACKDFMNGLEYNIFDK